MAFLLSGALCFGFAFLASIKVWPPLDGDAPAYFSPAVEFSSDRGLNNGVWLPPLDDSIDGLGGRRYIYHGFIYPLIIGWLAKACGGGAASCLVWMHYFNVLVSMVAARGVLGFCRADGAYRSCLAFCVPLAFFAICEALAGRPEPVVFLWFGLGLMTVQKFRAFCPVLLPFLLTLVFFSSPAVGALAFILLGALRLSQKADFRVQELAQGLGGVLAAAGICFLVYPYPATDWIMGVWRHSRINLGLPQGQGFFSTWIGRAQTPLLLFTFFVPFVLASWSLIKTVPSLSRFRRIMFCSLALVFLFGLAKVAFVKTEASYNTVVWIPVALAISAHFTQSSFAGIVLIGSLCLPVLGLVRSAIILGHQLTGAVVTFHETRAAIEEKTAEGIEVSPGLFLAVSDPRWVSFSGELAARESNPLWRIEQQTYRGVQSPPVLQGYRLVENRFGSPVRIFSVPISRTAGGWEYALYRRVD